jgi:hypothetical protein
MTSDTKDRVVSPVQDLHIVTESEVGTKDTIHDTNDA